MHGSSIILRSPESCEGYFLRSPVSHEVHLLWSPVSCGVCFFRGVLGPVKFVFGRVLCPVALPSGIQFLREYCGIGPMSGDPTSCVRPASGGPTVSGLDDRLIGLHPSRAGLFGVASTISPSVTGFSCSRQFLKLARTVIPMTMDDFLSFYVLLQAAWKGHVIPAVGNSWLCRRKTNNNQGSNWCRVNCRACFRYRVKVAGCPLCLPASPQACPDVDFTFLLLFHPRL